MKTLEEQQRQIIGQLNELKKLIQANSNAPLSVAQPVSLNVHEESFGGDSSARIAPRIHTVLNANVRDRHLDDVVVLGDPSEPFVASDRRKSLGHGLL
jgi:hypothetical protein